MKKAKRYTEAQARELLDEAIRKAGSQAAFADLHEISRQYITDVLKGRRDMSGKILEAIGLEKVIEYQCK
jgi:hypothetical protein